MGEIRAVANELDALTIAGQIGHLRGLGETLVKSGLLPASIKTPEAAVVIILKGRELGIPPMEALSSINVIQGKPTVSPQLMLALIYRSGQGSIQIIERSPTRSVVRAHRKGLPPQEFVFTLEDAKALGLLDKDNYRRQPATMLQWRNVAAAARAVFPDVISGLYTPEEMGAEVEVDDEGNMTVVESPTPASPPITADKPPPTTALEVDSTPPPTPMPESITGGHRAKPQSESKSSEKPSGEVIAMIRAMQEQGLGNRDRELMLAICTNIVGREITSRKDLSPGEALHVRQIIMQVTDAASGIPNFDYREFWEAYISRVLEGDLNDVSALVSDYVEMSAVATGR